MPGWNGWVRSATTSAVAPKPWKGLAILILILFLLFVFGFLTGSIQILFMALGFSLVLAGAKIKMRMSGRAILICTGIGLVFIGIVLM